jgi:hypothetical protein
MLLMLKNSNNKYVLRTIEIISIEADRNPSLVVLKEHDIINKKNVI